MTDVKVLHHLRYMRAQAARLEKSTTRFTQTYQSGSLDTHLGSATAQDFWTAVEAAGHVTTRLQNHVSRCLRRLGQRLAESGVQSGDVRI